MNKKKDCNQEKPEHHGEYDEQAFLSLEEETKQ